LNYVALFRTEQSVSFNTLTNQYSIILLIQLSIISLFHSSTTPISRHTNIVQINKWFNDRLITYANNYDPCFQSPRAFHEKSLSLIKSIEKKMRIEKDFIGEVNIPRDALYGIHSVRARKNFPSREPFHKEWYKAMGVTKLACYQTYKKYKQAVLENYPGHDLAQALFGDDIVEALISSAKEVSTGMHFDHFIVPAIQGGAGTSINLNVNEIIANNALIKLGREAGDYSTIDPIEQANVFQSTNDVVPTALKVAIMQQLNILEENINTSRFAVEALETKHRDDLRTAFTQMQQAVPSSFGKLFSAYSEAFSRDWWRTSKGLERIKTVNLGGSAIGTGLGVPRFFIMEVIHELQKLTGLPVNRGENPVDTTSNLDALVEVHAILKAHAVNLEKTASDLRFLSSGLAGKKEIHLPPKQVGSSIMPGKVNPVIPEYLVSVAHVVYANDQLVSSLCGQGNLELNPYLPTIGHAMLTSLKNLVSANRTFHENLLEEMQVDTRAAHEKLFKSPSITTALVPYIGYHEATKLAREMVEKGLDIYTANENLKAMEKNKLKEILNPGNLLRLGFSLKDLT
jgi:aspartate ammonia-lyase